MIKYYKNNEKGLIKKISKAEHDCWIDLVSPTEEEINNVSNITNINKELLLKLNDEEEVPRIELEDDSVLVVIDCPYYEEKTSEYYTFPLGVIINREYIVTVSSRKQELIKLISSNNIKDVRTNMKSRFLIQILYHNARLYLKYLRLINKAIEKGQKLLKDNTRNKELITMLNIEKSLVYFINSLRDNYVIIEKLSKGSVVVLYEEDLELLEDAEVENKQGIDMANTYREVLGSISDAYNNIISNNLNQAMKILTSITILFSVPTMISSFMGMNVPLGMFNTSPYSALILFISSIILSIIVAIYLKKKRLL